MRAVLKVNSPNIRDRLTKAGLELCPCCEWEESVWLTVSDFGIHGAGYTEEGEKVEEELAYFEQENEGYIDCNYNVEKFIKICKEHC